MQKNIRAFVALPIPDTAAAFIKRIRERLQPPNANIRWVPTQNIHVTLTFLGDIDPLIVPAITRRMDTVGASTRAFSLNPKGVGVFPNRRRARVVWVGLSGDIDRLGALQAALASGLETIGLKRESRSFRAHLTIGRMRQRIDPKILGELLEPLATAASESFRVDQLRLYQSVLKPSGAVYRLLHSASMATGQPTGSQ